MSKTEEIQEVDDDINMIINQDISGLLQNQKENKDVSFEII